MNLDYHAMNWDGCFGCGDEGCVDEDCYYCHSPLRPPNLRRLAQNLATAAGLCKAWELGQGPKGWKPGCGMSADGSELSQRSRELLDAGMADVREGRVTGLIQDGRK